MKKKMLGLLLAACIAMALVPMAAFAEGNAADSLGRLGRHELVYECARCFGIPYFNG